MAKSGGPTKPAKLTRAEKKALRAEKRSKRRETWRNLRQAFTLTRQNDHRFIPYLVIAACRRGRDRLPALFLIIDSPYFPIPFAVIVGLLAAMFVFCRRAQRSMFAQAEGQPGAAGWMLQQQTARRLAADPRRSPAPPQLDAVHRLVGRPGVVLVGEGAPHRVRGLIAQEKKRTARVVGDTPIYDVIVGTGEGDVRLGKLNRYLLKLPAQPVQGPGRPRSRSGWRRSVAGARRCRRARCRRARRCATCSARSADAPEGPTAMTPQRTAAYRGETIGLPATGQRIARATGAAAGRLRRRLRRLRPGRRAVRASLHRGGGAGTTGCPASWSLIPFASTTSSGCSSPGARSACTCSGCASSGSTASPRRPAAGDRAHRCCCSLLVPALIFDRDGRGLHDRLTDTAVVRACL